MNHRQRTSRWGAVFLVTLLVVSLAVVPSAYTLNRTFSSSTAVFRTPVATASSPTERSIGPSTNQSCATPQPQPHWNSSQFFQDVLVEVTPTLDPAQSGGAFQTIPCTNTLPRTTNGLWVNVSSDLPIAQAWLTVWAVGWPTPTAAQPGVVGFLPSFPAHIYLLPVHGNDSAVSYFINLYRFFAPGTQVFFNATVVSSSSAASPSVIYSAEGPYKLPLSYGNVIDNATWEFEVAAPWVSTSFVQDIQVSTNPPVLTNPSYPPNPLQTLQVLLRSISAGNGTTAQPIPAAILYVHLSGETTGNGSVLFGPDNHTSMSLTTPLGPYPGTMVQFNVTAYLPWRGGAVDMIYSPVYTFNWSKGGNWTNPSQGLTGNLDLQISPSINLSGSVTQFVTNTAVNITLHEPAPNVTISSAQMVYRYSDPIGDLLGQVPFTPQSGNTTFLQIQGLPPGGQLTFSIVAKDIYHDPIASGNYSYAESGSVQFAGGALVYIEGIDVSNGNLVPLLPFAIQNSTWSYNGSTNAFGFGLPILAHSSTPFPLSGGTYTVSVQFGSTLLSAPVVVGSGSVTRVVFFLSSGSVPALVNSPSNPSSFVAIGGLLVATVLAVPLLRQFRERRSLTEKDKERVTL